MMNQDVKAVQSKILDTMKFIDKICRENKIEYFIMGGTALGAVRHGGFIPWDDDLDIFMTPNNYSKFKCVFDKMNSSEFVLQEWMTTPNYLEYAKVRMNGTTFIESVYADNKDMHHGIYVDIMILHKCSNTLLSKRVMYFLSKYVTLYALSVRNWTPKNNIHKMALLFLKLLPNKWMLKQSYKYIYKYMNLEESFVYCYFITKAKFKQGIFEPKMFSHTEDVKFEDTMLLGPPNIRRYLEYRYGNYMKLPSEEEQKAAVHAQIFDTERDFSYYLEKENLKE